VFLVIAVGTVLVAGSVITSRGLQFGRTVESAESPGFRSGDPNMVAAVGERLERVDEPPTHTRTEIALSKDLGNPKFAIKFQPYGISSGGTAVIRVSDAVAQGGNKLAEEFARTLARQNLKVTIALSSASAMKTGGTYSAQLTLLEKNGVSRFEISNVNLLR
jgi:hypothetical protein